MTTLAEVGALGRAEQVGTDDDWDEYDRVMREQGRTAVLVEPTRIYGS